MAMTLDELDKLAGWMRMIRESFTREGHYSDVGLFELDDLIKVVDRERELWGGVRFQTINPENIRVLTNGAKSVKEGEQFDIDKVGFPSYAVPYNIDIKNGNVTLRGRDGEMRTLDLYTVELFHRPEDKPEGI